MSLITAEPLLQLLAMNSIDGHITRRAYFGISKEAWLATLHSSSGSCFFREMRPLHFIVGQVVPLATVLLVVAAVEEIVGVEEVVEISVCSWECACFPLPFVLLSQ